jgi:hypothetical protein
MTLTELGWIMKEYLVEFCDDGDGHALYSKNL